MSKKPFTEKENELKHHLLRRLVHVVVGNEEDVAGSAITFFIEQTLLELGNNKSQREIMQGVRQVFLLNFTAEEIGGALEKLAGISRVLYTAGRYSLEISRADEIRKKNTEARTFEERIFSDWLVVISSKYPNLSDEDKRNLVADLQLYLNKIFLQHGAECVTLIYPEEEKLNQLLKNYSTETLDKILPDRSHILREIRRVEFSLFLRQIDNEKKIYFAGMLDGTFVYNLIQVDPLTQKLIRDNYKNYHLYLDTNLLYAVFDLQDQHRTSKIEKAINVAKSFGMKITVSQQTVEEMKKSISLKKSLLLSSPTIKRELAEVGADISEEENFITAYWRAFHKTGISKEDFIEKLTHVSELLAAKNIPVEKGVEFTNDVIEKEVAILNASLAPQGKTENVARHDAYHRLLIRELRKQAEQQQKLDKYWFLSLDSLLLTYDRNTRDKAEMPFVLLPHQLLQILRPFGQRTQDYDAVFFELFSRPQIKSAQGVLPTNLTQKILAKMSGFNDLPPEIALSIILDQSFRKNVLGVGDDDVALNTLIETQTDNVLITELRGYKERLEQLELENQKRSRMTEAEAVEEKREGSKQERQITFYKNLACGALLVLWLVLNILAVIYMWGAMPKIVKVIAVAVDVVLLGFILRAREKISRAFQIALGVLAFVASVIQVVGS
ncbi:hypothetical protein A2118_00890 [Candidatus Kaiserbacteria bacterium GWA2_50_9]|uniref:PIN domain-containing protein n=1 Tax=Candidatus Kaiserbacteria bacterium GWA2_50_9 TaxID=1798474 RepID=A0A1F6BUI7_9BACT|nr:MAG: hypothetical protein A2118_00890 [Candidatus Kaiserbacteria bacterium GWA2_50_9]